MARERAPGSSSTRCSLRMRRRPAFRRRPAVQPFPETADAPPVRATTYSDPRVEYRRDALLRGADRRNGRHARRRERGVGTGVRTPKDMFAPAAPKSLGAVASEGDDQPDLGSQHRGGSRPATSSCAAAARAASSRSRRRRSRRPRSATRRSGAATRYTYVGRRGRRREAAEPAVGESNHGRGDRDDRCPATACTASRRAAAPCTP